MGLDDANPSPVHLRGRGGCRGRSRAALLAAKYDLLIKGGRVIDASQKLNGAMDVAIAAGRIAAVQPDIPRPMRPT